MTGRKYRNKIEERETMNIDDITFGQFNQLKAAFGSINPDSSSHPLLGKNVFIRTVTSYFTGRLDRVTEREFVLQQAA